MFDRMGFQSRKFEIPREQEEVYSFCWLLIIHNYIKNQLITYTTHYTYSVDFVSFNPFLP